MEPPSSIPPHDEFESLVARARTGDTEALASLIESSRDSLLQRIRFLMGDEARRVAETTDFVQDTFATALSDLDGFGFRGRSELLNWLTAIARNRIRQAVRKRHEQRLSSLSDSVGGRAADHTDGKAGFDELLKAAQAIEALPNSERLVIELHELQGLPLTEVAQRLGCSERHARRLRSQALLGMARSLRGRDAR